MILHGDDLCDVASVCLTPPPEEVNTVSVDVCIAEEVTLAPGEFATCPALEDVDMMNHVACLLTGRSAHMRKGIYMPGGMVDPGFDAELMLEFFNMSENMHVIPEGEPAARLTFFQLDDDVSPYDGKWSE